MTSWPRGALIAAAVVLIAACDRSPTTAPAATVTGTVKWFNNPKGLGFITPDDHTPDVFIHVSEIHTDGIRTLAEGQRVRFTIAVSSGQREARDVRLLR